MGGFIGELFAALSFTGAFLATIGLMMAAIGKGPAAKGWQSIGRIGFAAHGISVLGIIGTLFYLIYSHQYQYHYVWSHSSNELPVYYMISCFWEGQEGSFLLWTFWHVVLGAILLLVAKSWANVVVGVVSSVNLILASMILGIYIPGAGGMILFTLAILVPVGYLAYRYFKSRDDLKSKGVVHLGSIVIGLASIGLLATDKSGFFSFANFGDYFSAAGFPFLLAFLFLLGFTIYVCVRIVNTLLQGDGKAMNTGEVFSILSLITIGFIAYTTEPSTLKVGSTPFLMLKDAFPNIPVWETKPDFVPVNGNGLNPLLQNYWMVIHPPTLFLGFASTVVPFAYVIGGLITKRYTEWIRPSVPWLIFSVMILGIGIIMGGYWAYETLNFGGYWNWDPVENSSLVPWIAGIASLHALVAYRKSKAFLKLTMFLVVGTFLLILYSTFLTRSGILGETSVHAFTDLGMSGQLLFLMIVYVVWMIALFVSHWRMIPVARKTIATNSAEFVLFLGIFALIIVGIIITIATSIPVFNSILGTNFATIRDGSFFYYRWTIWFTIALAIFSGLGQFMYWKRVEKKKLSQAVLRPYLLAILCSAVVIFSIVFFTRWEFGFDDRYKDWQELADLSGNSLKMGVRYIRLAFFIFTDEILLFSSLFMVFANMDVLISLLRKKKKTRIVTGGSIAHIGFGLMLIGFLFSSGYDQVISKNVNPNELAALPQDARIDNVLLEKNRPRDILGYQVTYLGKKEAQPPMTNLEVVWEVDDEFKIAFEDVTGDIYATQLPKLVFLNAEGEIDLPFVKEFLDDKVDVLKPKHINDRTLYGLRFVPRVEGPNGEPVLKEHKAFTLYPEAEINKEMGLIAHPSRQIKATEDIYVHVSTIPREEEEQPRFQFYNFELGVGDTVQTSRAAIYFDKITSLPTEGTPFVLIAQANLRVFTDDGQMIEASPLYRIDSENKISIKDDYLEEIHTSIAFINIDPSKGKMSLQAQERLNPPEDIVVIQALKKPYINVLWIGTFVLVIGFGVAIVRRIRENIRLGGKSVAEKDEYEDGDAIS